MRVMKMLLMKFLSSADNLSRWTRQASHSPGRAPGDQESLRFLPSYIIPRLLCLARPGRDILLPVPRT